jgi:hypothetical protein
MTCKSHDFDCCNNEKFGFQQSKNEFCKLSIAKEVRTNLANCCPKPREISSSFLQQLNAIVARTNFEFHTVLDNN